MSSESQFFISKEKWHYRYYCWIRKLYLGQDDEPKTTSLCPYFHTMLWGTVFAVLAGPFMLIASLGLRACRYLLKFNNPVVDLIDSKTPLGNLARPVVGGFLTAIGILLVLTLLGGVVAFFYFLPDMFWSVISAFEYVAWGALYAGWAVFWLLGHVAWALEWAGWGLSQVGSAIIDFFTNGTMWIQVLAFALSVITYIAILAGIGFSFWAIGKIPPVSRFLQWLYDLVFIKINGYEAQLEVRAERIKQRKKTREEAERWTCAYCDGTNWERRKFCYHCGQRNPAMPVTIWEKIGGWFGGLKDKEIHLPKRPKWVSLGFLSSIATAFWAIKHRVCPMLEFMSEEELQAKVKAAVAENHKENEQRAMRLAGVETDDEREERERKENEPR